LVFPCPESVKASLGKTVSTTGFKTCFEARSSEKLVVKARGGKCSEACWSTSRTLFVENADPRALQPITAERGFETSCLRIATPFTTSIDAYVHASLAACQRGWMFATPIRQAHERQRSQRYRLLIPWGSTARKLEAHVKMTSVIFFIFYVTFSTRFDSYKLRTHFALWHHERD